MRHVKVLNITSLYSPFQIDIINSFPQGQHNIEYHVAFTILSSAKRGGHWQVDNLSANNFVHSIDRDGDKKYQAKWAVDLIDEIKPDLVIFPLWRGMVFSHCKRHAIRNGIKVGFWGEPPNFLLPKFIQFALAMLASYRVRDAEFYFSIGDRCEKFYKSKLKVPGRVYSLTYGQDLSEFLAVRRDYESYGQKKLKFLFSGQMVKRHNIDLIAKALKSLYLKYPGSFEFILAARGPEEAFFDKIIGSEPSLKDIVVYDRDYENWNDRINPFSNADVLIYPTSHSGWGLVVPEAMAAGVVVLSSDKAESARYFIRHGINGRIFDLSLEGLVQDMEYCLLNRDELIQYSKQARIDSLYGSSQFVAKRLHGLLLKVI